MTKAIRRYLCTILTKSRFWHQRFENYKAHALTYFVLHIRVSTSLLQAKTVNMSLHKPLSTGVCQPTASKCWRDQLSESSRERIVELNQNFVPSLLGFNESELTIVSFPLILLIYLDTFYISNLLEFCIWRQETVFWRFCKKWNLQIAAYGFRHEM